MNKLRDLLIDGVLLALPLGAVAYLVHKMVGLLVPMLTPAARFMERKDDLRRIPRQPPVGDGPIEEWLRAIKGDGPAPGSSFDYAAPLTEVVLLGVIAQRTGRTIEWDAEAMKVKGQPDLDPLVKEPAREGWRYDETLA